MGVVVEVWLEKVLKINFHGWVGVAGLLDQVGIRLSQLEVEVEAEFDKNPYKKLLSIVFLEGKSGVISHRKLFQP